MNEQSNAHEWESAGTNEQTQARALACTYARTNGPMVAPMLYL